MIESLLLCALLQDEYDFTRYGLDERGSPLCVVGDLNGDGAADFLVADRRDAARFWTLDGKTGRVLGRREGRGQREEYGRALAPLGDVDGDGVPDFAVGGERAEGRVEFGFVDVHSGADAALLYTFERPLGGASFGRAIAGGADLDQGGVCDIVIGDPDEDVPMVYVFRGEDGALRSELPAPRTPFVVSSERAAPHFGWALELTPDLDGDGVADLCVGAPDWSADGWAFVLSGAKCAPLSVLNGSVLEGFAPAERFGWTLGTLVDAAGSCRIVASEVGRSVSAFDAERGALEWTYRPGPRQAEGAGASLATLADVDGDGAEDLVLGVRRSDSCDAGALRVLSGATGDVLFEAQVSDLLAGSPCGCETSASVGLDVATLDPAAGRIAIANMGCRVVGVVEVADGQLKTVWARDVD